MVSENWGVKNVVAWADKFIEENRALLERMHGYTSEMQRHDELAKQIREMRSNKVSKHSDAR